MKNKRFNLLVFCVLPMVVALSISTSQIVTVTRTTTELSRDVAAWLEANQTTPMWEAEWSEMLWAGM